MKNKDKLKVLEPINRSHGDLVMAECLYRATMWPFENCHIRITAEFQQDIDEAKQKLDKAQANYQAEEEKLKAKLSDLLPEDLQQTAELLLLQRYPADKVAEMLHYSSGTIYRQQRIIMKTLAEAEEEPKQMA